MRSKLALTILIALFSGAAVAQGEATPGAATTAPGAAATTTGGMSFSAIDKNQDGSIDDGEWDGYFDTLDTNDDDKLDQSELSAAGMGGAPAAPGTPPGAAGETQPGTSTPSK
jgi:hypothetical protein